MTLFFHIHKYIMKDFNEYIINLLNEAENFDDLFIKNNDNKTIKLKKDDTEDIGEWINNFHKEKGNYVYKSDSGTYTPDKTLINLVKSLKKQQNDFDDDTKQSLKTIDVDKFNKLGQTIGYRSALAIAVNGDNFQQVAKDVMKDMDDYSIKQLQDVPEFFSFAAAVKTLNDIKKRESKDKIKIKEIDSILSDLSAEATRDMALNDVKEKYKDDWEKNYKLYENNFNAGLKEIREKMTKSDFDWKDPATGLPPKGLKGKTTQFLSKQVAKIGELGEKLAGKIPSQHTLENEMARLACFGVKALTKGVGAIAGLIRSANDWNNFRKQAKTVKYNDIEKKIKLFKKEFDEYMKTKKQTPKQESLFFMGKLITEAETNDKRQEILDKLNNLMYNDVLKYYYYKISNIVSCFTNKDNMFVVKQDENGWNTFNTSSGNLTVLEDNRNLMVKLLNTIKKDLYTVFNEFKDETLQNCTRTIPNEIKFESDYSSGLKDWINNLNKDPGLMNILNIYNEKVIISKNTLSSKKFGDYVKILDETISSLNNGVKIAVLKNSELTFKNDNLNVNVPGIVGQKNDETTNDSEEKTNQIPDNIKNELSKEGKMLAYSGDTLDSENTTEQIDTLKAKNDELNKTFMEWLSKPENKTTKETFDEMSKDIKDIINQLLPSIWIKKQITDTIKSDLKDNYWYPYRVLNLLTEKKERNIQKAMTTNQALLKNANKEQTNSNEETVQPKQENNDNFGKIRDAVANILDNDVEELYKTTTTNDFKTLYGKWTNSIKNVYSEIMKINREETQNTLKTYEGKDPYLVAAACNVAIQDLIDWSKENSEKAQK